MWASRRVGEFARGPPLVCYALGRRRGGDTHTLVSHRSLSAQAWEPSRVRPWRATSGGASSGGGDKTTPRAGTHHPYGLCGLSRLSGSC